MHADAKFDWLDDGDGLLAWLEQAQLAPREALETLRSQATPGELDSVAAHARSRREWFRGFVRQHKGRPLTSKALDELAPLNRLLERDERFGRIGVDDHSSASGLAFRKIRRWRSPEALLLPIGEALATFVCEEDFSNVKACEGPACTLLFADHTRGRARRWCSMAICGNRAKQAAHRNRLSCSNKIDDHRQALRLPVICGALCGGRVEAGLWRFSTCPNLGVKSARVEAQVAS